MSRKGYILPICLLGLFMIGCSNNNVPEEPTTQEYNVVIENPSVDIENDNLSSFYTNFVIQNNYRVYRIVEKSDNIDFNIAIPDWQFEDNIVIDTIDFINLSDDEMSDKAVERTNFLNEKLRPSGMSTGRLDKKEWFMTCKYPYIKEYASDILAEYGSKRQNTYTIMGLWDYLLRDGSQAVDKYDVVCMSINMYEGFYNYSNSTKLLVYGIPQETFESNLRMDSGYEAPETNVILKKYHNGECRLDTLTEVELTKSGNYYMDFSQIIANDEYKDIIIEMELTGEVTDEYTYAWYGFGYKIDNEQTYQNWKAENADKFIY